MTPTINGIHHVTAISGGAQANLDFYTRVLGLRLVKKTVNFDDPSVYHLYYGDEIGHPGTVLTFFPWEQLPRGRRGTGEASLTAFSVPPGSLDFWRQRLAAHRIAVARSGTAFDEERLAFRDPDGMALALVVPRGADDRAPWVADGIDAAVAIRGFHGVTLTLADHEPTGRLLTGLFGYEFVGRAGSTRRYATPHARQARFVDVVELPDGERARQGAGSVHHVAFSVRDRAAQADIRARLSAAGFRVTPPVDRDYFHAIYFRSPGGVLFEVATEEPGFTVDEPISELGHNLKLPSQHEHLRVDLERSLPALAQ